MGFEAIDRYIESVGGRRLAPGEWGLEVEGLSVGLRVAGGLLRAGCWAAPSGDASVLLHRNRSLGIVRYASTRRGEIWVVGDVPATADAPVDRLLGALVEAALALR